VARRRIGRRSLAETETQLDVSLHELKNVAVRRGHIGRPRLVLELAHGRPSFDVLEPEAWTGTIAQAKRALPPSGTAAWGSTHTIERQVVKVRCRFCGALGNEVDGRCPSCGAPL
jgi:ribosomal protein L37E